MVKKICVLYLFSNLFFLACPVFAFEPFAKHPNNPLPINVNYQNWSEIGRYQPTVLYEDGMFKMWYASYAGSQFKVSYNTSLDGINWASQNLFDLYPGFDNHDPSILKTQNGYTLFFVASTGGGAQNFKIYKIDSIDGVNFDQNSRQLVLQPINNMESNAVSSPSVIYKNDTYYLFYLCWGNLGFRICMATSTDGTNWNRCPNNPIINQTSDGPSILKTDTGYYLFFQGNGGIHQVESTDQLSCSMNWVNDQIALLPGQGVYDSQGIIGPSVTNVNNSLYLYYSGIGSSLTINLAVSEESTSENQYPTVIIPGLLASWNKDALLHNQQVNPNDWMLNPIVKEYSGLIQTLEALGLEQNQDFYLFAYDWRKKLEDIAGDLRTFLLDTVFSEHPDSKINLVGHSLGGLTSRILAQKFGTEMIDKIVTIGSPHQGVAQAYTAVEGGEFDRSDKFQWLVQKIVLQLNKDKFQSDRKTLNEVVPVLNDLFPVFDFLYDANNQIIPINNLKINNTSLLQYNPGFSSLFPQLQTIAGEKGNTLAGYKVGPRSITDILLDLYPDGRPTNSIHEVGDQTVLSKSAKADTDYVTMPLDHGELVYKKGGIETILDALQMSYDDDQIIEGTPTQVFPSLIFLLKSPAEMEVQYNGQIFSETEGVIFIDNAQNGIYTLSVKGLDYGKYSVIIGQVGLEKDSWYEINGEILQNPPPVQTDVYTVTFDSQNPLENPVNQNDVSSLFDLLVLKTKKTYDSDPDRNLRKIIEELKVAKKYYLTNKFDKTKNLLDQIHKLFFTAIKTLNEDQKQNIFEAISDLENLYSLSLTSLNPKPPKLKLQIEIQIEKSLARIAEKLLLYKKQKGGNVAEKALHLQTALEKLDLASDSLQKSNLWYTEILLESIKEFLKI